MKYLYNKNQDDYGLKYVDENGIGWKCKDFIVKYPPQHQNIQPGMEYLMYPKPIFDNPNYKAGGKLIGKTAIITGGDSGIGKAVAVAFAKEGANIVITYLNEDIDAMYTKNYLTKLGAKTLFLKGDIRDKNFSKKIVAETIKCFGKIDILINNAGVQYQQKKLTDITDEQFDKTMKVNVYGMFYLTKAALPYLKSGSSIINVSSITTFKGEPELIDYVTSKGAIVGFTRALSTNLAPKNIRVNAIAPGFFWTPLQPACWEANKIPTLGADSPMKRGGEPYELAPIFVYLASDDASYTTGQVFHINGGEYKG